MHPARRFAFRDSNVRFGDFVPDAGRLFGTFLKFNPEAMAVALWKVRPLRATQ